MSGQTLKLLLDTNVWLDLFIPSNPGHRAAWDFLRATADRAQADYLVTSDTRLARKARVATGTPRELNERMAAGLL